MVDHQLCQFLRVGLAQIKLLPGKIAPLVPCFRLLCRAKQPLVALQGARQRSFKFHLQEDPVIPTSIQFLAQ